MIKYPGVVVSEDVAAGTVRIYSPTLPEHFHNHGCVADDGVELRLGNWARIQQYEGDAEPCGVYAWDAPDPLETRVSARSAQVTIRTEVEFHDPAVGTMSYSLWSPHFGRIGDVGNVIDPRERKEGDEFSVWIVLMSPEEHSRYVQRTGHVTNWKVAPTGGGAGSIDNRGIDSRSIHSSRPGSSAGGREEEGEPVGDGFVDATTRIRPDGMVEKIGVVSGKAPNAGVFYVWSPNGNPMKEGTVQMEEGKEIEVCDWIGYTIRIGDQQRIFEKKLMHRFEVVEYWKLDEPCFPTRLSPNKATIELAIGRLVLSTENTSIDQFDEMMAVDKDVGKIGDRNNQLRNWFPMKEEDEIVLTNTVVRRIKPRNEEDAVWMLLHYTIDYRGPRRSADEERNNGNGAHDEGYDGYGDYGSRGAAGRDDDRRRLPYDEYDDRNDDYHNDSGRGSGGAMRSTSSTTNYLLRPPKFRDQVPGDVVRSVAFVEGICSRGVFVWLVDVAASGVVVNGDARSLELGDCVYGVFRLQGNGKWSSTRNREFGRSDPPPELEIKVRNNLVTVIAPVSYEAVSNELRNPWFGVIVDTDRLLPRDITDNEIFTVELTKMRHHWNIRRVLN